MGRRNNYKGWDSRANSQGNAFGGGRQSNSGQGRGGQQHNTKNAFSGGGGNAFSALAETSQPRSSQNIAQRVSFPAAQRNSFASSPANAFGGASPQSQFQPPPTQQSPLNNSGFSRPNAFGGGTRNTFNSSNAFTNNANAFQSQGFGGSSMQQSNATGGFNAFSGAAANPQPSGFGGNRSQFSNNAFSGAVNPEQAAFTQPRAQAPQQQNAFGCNPGGGFNAFSAAQQPAAAPMGFQNRMTAPPVAPSNAFAGVSPGSQPFNAPQPSGNIGGFPSSRAQNAFGNVRGFGNAGGMPQAGMGGTAGFGGQMGSSSALPGFSSGGGQRGAAKAFSDQRTLSEADQAAWMSDTFEKGMIPELPPPASVC